MHKRCKEVIGAGIVALCLYIPIFADTHIPMAIGNNWEYGTADSTEYTLTIMRDTVYDGNTFYGVALPSPDSQASSTWDSAGTWIGMGNDWWGTVSIGGNSYLVIKDMLETPIDSALRPAILSQVPIGTNWSYKTSQGTTIQAWVVGYEDITVPAGQFNGCLKIKSSFTMLDYARDAAYEVISYIWFADNVGMVKDSSCAETTGYKKATLLRNYIFK